MGDQGPSSPAPVISSRSSELLGAIEARLGFVPPFFEPAVPHPDVLENLWHQTRTAYLDNPLPALFKEKIAAILAGNCGVPYCLMCHSCALRPLGLPGDGIVRLLRMSRPSQPEVQASMARLAAVEHLAASGIPGSAWEDDLLHLATAVYAGEKMAGAVRNVVRRALDAEAYDNLVLFISYNKTCHDWMSAHPEVGYELDERYAHNYAPLVADTPEVADVLAWASSADQPGHATDADAIAKARAAEVDRMAVLSEQRLAEVFTTMNKRLKGALHDIDEGNKVRAEVEETSAFAQELLAIVSHDLRNPLAVVIAASGVLLRRHQKDAALADVLRRIVRSADRATRLVGELLDFSQARIGGGIPVVRQPGNIHDLVRHVVDEIEISNPDRVIISDRSGPGDGAWDSDRIVQVLSNLVSNALTHSPPQSRISIRIEGGAETVSVTIANQNRDGPIPSEVIPSLFDPFKRGVIRTTAKSKSVGLGLYIVQQIVKGHGGDIHVVSDAEGTAISVSLPRADPRSSGRLLRVDAAGI